MVENLKMIPFYFLDESIGNIFRENKICQIISFLHNFWKIVEKQRQQKTQIKYDRTEKRKKIKKTLFIIDNF